MIKDIILNSAAKMAENCHQMDFVESKGEKRIPDRGATIQIIKELRRVLFPGFFGDENISLVSPEYFIGDTLTQIYIALKKQVALSLSYRDREIMTDREIDEKAETITRTFMERLPHVQEMLMKDVEAGYLGDPAAKSREEVVISYPGLFAIFVYRLAHELYVQDVPLLPRIMTEYAHSKTGIDINSGAQIGEYFFIDHGTGVVVGETTVIGAYVKLYQGVTLGALSTRSGQKLKGKKRHPTICDHVTVYSGATILGGETVIGEGVIVSGGAFVTKSVPAFSKVTVKNPELVIKDSEKKVELTGHADSEGLWEI